uniref:Uncharacterized protein n=1 Tax=Salix viminalis TaxID=40686 RepID=A0A6N2M683_SALVM
MAQIHLPCIGRVLIIQLTHGYPVESLESTRTLESAEAYFLEKSEDPAPGMFSIQFFIEWNRSHRYWTSGDWHGERNMEEPRSLMSFAGALSVNNVTITAIDAR